MKRVTGLTKWGSITRTLVAMALLGPMFLVPGCGGGDDNGGGGGGGSSGGGAASQFAYVANWDSNNVSMFGVDANGALSPIGIVPAGSHPHVIAVDPRGRFVYVANHDSDFLSGYTIDRNTGALTPIVSPSLIVGANTHAPAFDSQGRFMYVIHGPTSGTPADIHSYTVNNDGTLTQIGTPLPAGVHAHNLTVDPTDKFVYVAGETSNETLAYAIQPNGGLASIGTVFGSGGGPDAVAVVSTFAYVANRGGLVQNFNINPTTGALTPNATQPTVSAGTLTHAITSDNPNSNFIYAANISSNDVSAYSINKANGVLTPLAGSPFATGASPEGIAPARGGFLYTANFGANNITRFVINQTTGELTQRQEFANATGGAAPIGIAVTNF